jgi:anaerobic ribonucleoside-triphosphate reductase
MNTYQHSMHTYVQYITSDHIILPYVTLYIYTHHIYFWANNSDLTGMMVGLLGMIPI